MFASANGFVNPQLLIQLAVYKIKDGLGEPGVVRSLALTIEFFEENSREFYGVLGALPLGEGVAENAVVELVETSAVGARGRLPPSWRKICVKNTKKN